MNGDDVWKHGMFVFYDGTQADTHTSRMGDVLGAVGEWRVHAAGRRGVYLLCRHPREASQNKLSLEPLWLVELFE